MDKIVYYSIEDMLSRSRNLSLSIRITTQGFPVNETVEYQNNNEWSEYINTINKENTNEKSINFKSRVESLLDDDNIRVIMDIMKNYDEYYSDEYKLKIIVNSLEIN
ncbi:hypothetical protein [Methanosphaera sp. WGK6]|uniref:hypothetical protein n=1 Tax=Methanosphaera sp. WGK6 TaxID=1561964 RepID=UPI00084BCFF6|nr:hypothetical protein [Methanosphaera sp. WGK6]OED30775.1 hypothetical protein NL43_00170 [Methanosphaera sp. WGK6]